MQRLLGELVGFSRSAFFLVSLLLVAQVEGVVVISPFFTIGDRGVFLSQFPEATGEGFEGSGSELRFVNGALFFQDLTVIATGNVSTDFDRNILDLPPAEFATLDVNGTAFLNVGLLEGGSFMISFLNPVFSFGADFSGLNDELSRTDIIVNGQTLSAPASLAGEVFFWGVTSETPFSQIEFRARDGGGGDAFGIDNLVFSVVPEPTTSLLGLVSGLILLRRVRGKRSFEG